MRPSPVRSVLVLLVGLAVVVPASQADAARSGLTGKAARYADEQRGATEQIVLFDEAALGADREVDRAVFKREKMLGFVSRHRYRTLRGFSARLTARQIAALQADPAVLMVVPDSEVTADGQTALATGEAAPPGVRRVGAATLTTASLAAPTNVAVLDTGVDLANADLNARHGVNCVSAGGSSNDDHGHGTHVAGTIAARNVGTGVVGVAPATTVYSVKVLSAKQSGTVSQILCGIDWVARNAGALGIGVVNMSLGGTGKDDGACGTVNGDAWHQAVCRGTAAGLHFVASAGNSGRSFAAAIPAAYREVLTATAMSDADGAPGGTGSFKPLCKTSEVDDRYAASSNFAATAAEAAHVIAAPGTCVVSTKRGGGTVLMSGTSMAAPHVAGAVASCLAASCAGLSSAGVIAEMRALAAADAAGGANGFAGDPSRPVSGRTYGWLVSSRS